MIVHSEAECEGVSHGQHANLPRLLGAQFSGAETERICRKAILAHIWCEDDLELHVISEEAVVDALGGGGQNKFRSQRLHGPKAGLREDQPDQQSARCQKPAHSVW